MIPAKAEWTPSLVEIQTAEEFPQRGANQQKIVGPRNLAMSFSQFFLHLVRLFAANLLFCGEVFQREILYHPPGFGATLPLGKGINCFHSSAFTVPNGVTFCSFSGTSSNFVF